MPPRLARRAEKKPTLLWTRALDEAHSCETPDSEMKPSESNFPTHGARTAWDAFE